MNRYSAFIRHSKVALLSLLLPATVQAVDTEYFGKLLFEAQQNGSLLPDIYRINSTLDDQTLYDIQKAYVTARLDAGDVIGGYKGGFLPKASVGGVLFGGEKILGGRPSINKDDFSLLVVEAEIGFKFCKSITAPIVDIASLKKYVCEIMPVMEIADGAIADFGDVKKNFKHLRSTLISINVASSHTLLGDSLKPGIKLSSLPVSMNHNGKQIGARDMQAPFHFLAERVVGS